jgi:WD40 repeat protein
MPTATRTFRVFVSSTFEDLKAERDALQREVFPRLRKLCEANNARFQAIDLRWGVRDEAALDQQTMEICLREIERCQQTGIKPNFIVLLGERYGWRPLPARIEAGEFNKVRGRVVDADKSLIDDWYERDDNAVPPEFLLKPREGEFADKDRWGEVEQRLHRILREAAREAGLPSESLIKYEASATHQEILKGLGQSEEDRKHVFAFFREPAEGVEEDEDLSALKEDLRQKLPEGNIRLFSASRLDKLCVDVEAALSAVILAETGRFTSRAALDLEMEAHDRFAADRCRIFVGRGDVLTAVSDYLSGPERRPLVLHGPSGSGKSAVMAKASQQHIGPGRVVRRFIGASPESSSGHALLTSLCMQIAPGDTPVDYYQLERAFQERLATATAEQPLILFIDALDQLSASDPARGAAWLPAELPAYVKVVVSTTDDGERLPNGLQVPLATMTMAEGGQALDELLRGTDPKEKRRTLQPWQRDFVLKYFERCGLPLYLKLAAEESRLWRSFSPPDACRLGEGISGVLDTLFDRLASNANHGPVLVERSLGYLAAARYGLTEDEMLDVLAADDAVWNDFDQRKHHEVSERRLPVVVWSRLSLDLEPYLTERAAPGGTVIAFYHKQLAERVVARFLDGNEAQARHSDLASYFHAKPAWLDEGRKAPNARRAAELVFQQRGARQWAKAEATLFDCTFLFSKVAAGMVLDLDDDYQALLRDALQSELPRCNDLRLLQGTLRLSLNVVIENPDQFASQMRGRLLVHQAQPEVTAFLDDLDACASRPRLWPLRPTLEAAGGAALRILGRHGGSVWAVALSADGKRAISASRDHTLRVWDLEGNQHQPPRVLQGYMRTGADVALSADGKRAVSVSDDKTLQVWDLEGSQPPRVLEGHTDQLWKLTLSGDGKRAVCTSGPNLLIWDLESSQPPRFLEGHADCVNAVTVSADGGRAVSGSGNLFRSRDNSVRVWDLEGNQPPRVLKGHTGCVNAVALSADCKLAVSGSADGTLRVWDLEGNRPPRILECHKGVFAVALSADGKRAVSSSFDETVLDWDLEGNQPPRVLKGHLDAVCAVAISADGRRAVSGSDDGTLRVWDLEANQPTPILESHTAAVRAVAISADSKLAVSGSSDKTLRVWDLEGNQPPRVLKGHWGRVNAVALSGDGQRAVSCSNDRTLRVWDIEGKQPSRLSVGLFWPWSLLFSVLEDATFSSRNRFKKWLISWIGESLNRFRGGHEDSVEAVALTADGRRAVSGSDDCTLRIWNLEGSQLPHILKGHTKEVKALAASADGKRAISGSFDETLRVWDLEGNQPPRILQDHWNWFAALALSADGKRAVCGSYEMTLRIWDLEGNWSSRVLEGHSHRSGDFFKQEVWVTGVAMSGDGKRAVVSAKDHTVRVWDLESCRCLAIFTCDCAVRCCAWARDRIVAGDERGHVHLFAWEE